MPILPKKPSRDGVAFFLWLISHCRGATMPHDSFCPTNKMALNWYHGNEQHHMLLFCEAMA